MPVDVIQHPLHPGMVVVERGCHRLLVFMTILAWRSLSAPRSADLAVWRGTRRCTLASLSRTAGGRQPPYWDNCRVRGPSHARAEGGEKLIQLLELLGGGVLH